MNDEIPMLSIIKRGSTTFPRVIVAKSDEFRNPLYWTGSGWSAEEAEAMVYANINDASWFCHDVLMESVGDLPCHRFVVPLRAYGYAYPFIELGLGVAYPLMPQFLMTVLGGNRFHLGIIEGVAESVSSLLKLWAGAWSDRAGQRKGFVVFGYALAAVARPLLGLVTAPWQFFAARIGDRVGKGLRTAPRDALIADSTAEGVRGRAFGFHRAKTTNRHESISPNNSAA